MDMDKTRKNLWDVYFYRGMGDTTIYRSETARRLLINLSSAFLSLANEYNQRGQKEQAMAQLQKATQVVSGDWRTHAFLADLYTQSQDYRAAERELTSALKYNPEFFVLYHMLGSVNNLMGELDRAQAHYEKAMELNPGSQRLVFELAELYQSRGLAKKARELLENWLYKHPDDTTAQRMWRHWAGVDEEGQL